MRSLRSATRSYGSGSHLRLRHPTNARAALTVPDHVELKTGLLRALIRDSGMTVEEFVDALP